MTARDWFGLVVRVLAVWLFVWGCWNLIAALYYLPATLGSFVSQQQTAYSYSSLRYAIYGLPAAIVGLLVLRFAEGVVRFTYRQ